MHPVALPVTDGELKVIRPKFVMAGYIRVSGPEQARRDKASLTIQKKDLMEHARKNGWRIYDIYRDVISGGFSFENRNDGSRLLNDAMKEKFNVVGVWDSDRLGRDREGKATSDFRSEMRELGVQIYSLNQPHQLKDPDEYKEDPYEEGQILVENIHDWQSASTISKFRRRSMKGKEERVRRGKMINTPPFGYRLEPQRDSNGEIIVKKDGRVVYLRVIYEKEAKIVRRIYYEYVYEGKSMNEIRDSLNREGIPTRKRGAWERASIGRILKNPVYWGVLIYNKYYRRKSSLTGKTKWGRNPREKWIIVPPEKTEHEAIITQELFEEAQRIRKAKLRVGAVAVYSDFLFSGLAQCAICGHKMYKHKVNSYRTLKSNGERRKYQSNGYLCGRWQRFRDTEKNYISERDLKEAIFRDLKNFKDNPLTLRSFLEENKQKDLLQTRKIFDSRKNALSKVEKRYNRLLKAYELGYIPLKKFDAAVGRLSEEEKGMRLDVERLGQEVNSEAKRELGRREFIKAIGKFEEIFESGEIKMQKKFLRSLIENIVVKKGRITINYWLGD